MADFQEAEVVEVAAVVEEVEVVEVAAAVVEEVAAVEQLKFKSPPLSEPGSNPS